MVLEPQLADRPFLDAITVEDRKARLAAGRVEHHRSDPHIRFVTAGNGIARAAPRPGNDNHLLAERVGRRAPHDGFARLPVPACVANRW